MINGMVNHHLVRWIARAATANIYVKYLVAFMSSYTNLK